MSTDEKSENAASVSNEAPAPPAASKPAASAPRSTAGGSSSSGGKDLPPSALARAYEEACQKHGVSKNSALFDQLSLGVGETLDLSKNYIGNRGVIPLVEVLDQVSTLRKLNLHDNGLRNDAAVALTQYLSNHPSLTSIDVSQNQISLNGGKALLELLANNPRIRALDYSNNRIDVDVRLKLKQVLDQRNQ